MSATQSYMPPKSYKPFLLYIIFKENYGKLNTRIYFKFLIFIFLMSAWSSWILYFVTKVADEN